MKDYIVIFEAAAKPITITAAGWTLVNANGETVARFFNENGTVTAMFRWDQIIGVYERPEVGLRYEEVKHVKK